MPIDEAMRYELAEEWLTPYLDAERLNATHPLREDAFKAADAAIFESYAALGDDLVSPYDDADVLEAIAEDVVSILRGVAMVIVASEWEAKR